MKRVMITISVEDLEKGQAVYVDFDDSLSAIPDVLGILEWAKAEFLGKIQIMNALKNYNEAEI